LQSGGVMVEVQLLQFLRRTTYDFAVMRALECQAGNVGLCTAHQYGLKTMHLMMRCGMLDAASDSGQHNKTGSLGVTPPILAFVQVSTGLRAVASLPNCTQWATSSTFICAGTRISHVVHWFAPHIVLHIDSRPLSSDQNPDTACR
jgi:hypothetical protein